MKKVRKFVSIIVTLCFLLTLVPAGAFAAPAESTAPFDDVQSSDWFYEPVQYIYDEGLMAGTGDRIFSPQQTTTRGMIVTILHRMAGGPDAEAQNFTDVDADAWYAPAINWSIESGVGAGYGGGLFGPDDAITREQMASFLYRYAELEGYDVSAVGDLNDFADASAVSNWAKDVMSWAVGAELFAGRENNNLAPQGLTTRAEAATILMRYCENIVGTSAEDPSDEPSDDPSDEPDTPVVDDPSEDDKPSIDPTPDDPDGPSTVEIFTITFESNGGSPVASQTVKAGEVATIPDEPSKENEMFIGWYEDPAISDWSDLYAFDTSVKKNLTLYAGWVDATTDSDNDGLADDFEEYIGTNSQSKDSDNDGLTDYQEEMLFDYDPLNKDTDNDGVEDGAEDHDNDGLPNTKELEIGTDPILYDSDNDGLNDGEEVNTHKTKPLQKDTDSDGASDGDEIRLGTDPLTAQDSFTEKQSYGEVSDGNPVTVEVEAAVAGNQVGTLNINPETYGSNPMISPTIPGYLGVAYDIEMNGQPSSAKLTFKYDTALGEIGEEFQPTIYYYNEQEKMFEEVANQNRTSGEVSVDVSHFSIYILLNKVEFDQVWENEIKTPDTATKNLSIAFVIDISGSMSGQKISAVKTVANEFVEKMGDKDRAAIVAFDDSASVIQPLTNDKGVLSSALTRLRDSGGTDIAEGVESGISVLAQDAASDSYDVLLLLTDGQDGSFNSYCESYAQKCVENGITAYSIGIGTDVSSTHLTTFAEGTNGKYYHATEAEDLGENFESILIETVDVVTDSNNDGISDYYTQQLKEGKLVLSNGSQEFFGIDLNYDENGQLSADFDGDGIRNGDELVVKNKGGRVYVEMISDPRLAFSDSDDFTDGLEFEQGSDPMVASYPATIVDYSMTDSNFTYLSILNAEDKWWKEGARQIWSTITFNWDHKDEAKRTLARFFDENYAEKDFNELANDVMIEMSDQLSASIIDESIEEYKDGKITYDVATTIAKDITKWKAAIHSAGNLNTTDWGKFKATIGLLENKYSFKGISSADLSSSGLFFVADEVIDIYQWIESYGAIVATQSAFQQSKDILTQIKDNDDAKEKYVSRAAEDILLVADEKYVDFLANSAWDISMATTENIANIAISLLSSANPYATAINLIISGLDAIAPNTKIAEATYNLYVADELVNASKNVFEYDSEGNDFYNLLDTQKRPLDILINSRLLGSGFARQITDNQIYWGESTEEVREMYREIIDMENDRLSRHLELLNE